MDLLNGLAIQRVNNHSLLTLHVVDDETHLVSRCVCKESVVIEEKVGLAYLACKIPDIHPLLVMKKGIIKMLLKKGIRLDDTEGSH